MFAEERRGEIAAMVAEGQTPAVSLLMERYGVSIETIRRDLACLEARGLLRRVHGGAVSPRHSMLQAGDLSARSGMHQAEKEETARAVVEQLREGERIILDSGSTAREIALALCRRFRRMEVITHSFEVLQLLSRQEGFRLIQVGGEYLPEEQAFCGYLAEDMLRGLHAQTAILCPGALSREQGIGDSLPRLIPLQRILAQSADRVIAAADSCKLNKTAPFRLLPLTPFLSIATDRHAPEDFLQYCREKGIIVHFTVNKEEKHGE